MGDGSSGGIGGVLFEAGKAAGKALGGTINNQLQQTGNALTGQLGATKPLFGGQKPQGIGGQAGKANPFGGLGGFDKMFESAKPGLGAKPPLAQSPQWSQAQLDEMATQNKAKDDQQIEQRRAELEQIKMQKHKQLHDEVYYEAIKNAGQNSIAQDRKDKQQKEEQEAEQQQQAAQAQQQDIMPGSPLAKTQQLGDPINVQQAKTQTEVNRGTTG